MDSESYLPKNRILLLFLLAVVICSMAAALMNWLTESARVKLNQDTSANEDAFNEESKPKAMFEEEKKKLNRIEYYVTQQNGTERPFTGEYDQHFEPGIYVDIVSGKALFASTDKYDHGCGWPAFSKPIEAEEVAELKDETLGMARVEVRSKTANSHLGHVFNDGPKELGGIRYCINSASLKFIPLAEMEPKGYAKYIPLVKTPPPVKPEH